MLFPTTLVGSYPQPDWLIDRAKLAGRFPPRVRARDVFQKKSKSGVATPKPDLDLIGKRPKAAEQRAKELENE